MKKRALTLFELMLCMAILVLISTLALGPGLGALNHYRARSDFKRLHAKLCYLKQMSLLYHADIVCALKKGETGLVLVTETHEPPLRHMGTICNELLLPHLVGLDPEEEVSFAFSASGFFQGPKQIVIKTRKEKLAIDLNIS